VPQSQRIPPSGAPQLHPVEVGISRLTAERMTGAADNLLRVQGPLSTEWSVLLTACSSIPCQEKFDRLQNLLLRSFSWTSLAHLADQHGVTSLLYDSLSPFKDPALANEMRLLEQRYRTNLHKALFITRGLVRILDHLEALSIEVIPYKGVALSESIYGDIGLRQTGDIDLLIRPGDWERVKEAVGELGYTPHMPLSKAEERAYLISWYECAFDSSAGRNLVEVQWALQPRYFAVDFEMAGLFQRTSTVVIAGRRMKTLSAEDLLLVLSVHAAKHVWRRLLWLCDIAQILKQPGLNWNWIEEQAMALGIVRILKVTLHLANQLLGSVLPGFAETGRQDDRAILALTQEIRAQVLSGDFCKPETLAYFRLMMRLRERRADRMLFLRRLAFTPGPGEWKAVRLVRPLFPLYRLVRLGRLAKRLARAA
jgi:Uncharacterised nucleotidyltransferase